VGERIRRCENKRIELDRVISAAVENDPARKHHLKVFRQLGEILLYQINLSL